MWQKLGFLGRKGIFAQETSLFRGEGLIICSLTSQLKILNLDEGDLGEKKI
jgi:hypothetical protein